MTARETRLPSTIARQDTCARVIRALWGKVPLRVIAETAGESYSFVQKVAAEMGMPRLSTIPQVPTSVPAAPKGYPREAIAWAREHAAGDREAAMILAHTGQDVRRLGWR